MPNPYFTVKHITRAAGQSAVASAAYRSAEELKDYRSVVHAAAYRSGDELADTQRGQVFSFVRKEGVLHKDIYTPANAPDWAKDRERLWNEVEHAEDKSTRRATARLARDFVASLPRELSHEQHKTMVAGYVKEQFTDKGLVVDVAFHEVKARDGGQNPHVHMMVTTRTIEKAGFEKKARWLDKQETLASWRNGWEQRTNKALEAAGIDERLSLKSYKERGINKEATKPLGYEASALEKKGVQTRQGDANRRIEHENVLREIAPQHIKPREPKGKERGEKVKAFARVTADNLDGLKPTAPAARDERASSWAGPQAVGMEQAAQSPEQEHQAVLRDYSIQTTSQRATTLINRISKIRAVMNTAIEEGKGIFDRFGARAAAFAANETSGKQKGRGYER